MLQSTLQTFIKVHHQDNESNFPTNIKYFKLFLFYYGLWLLDAHNTNCKSEIKRNALPPPKCFRRNNYLFNLLDPTRDGYNAHSIIVWKHIIHISMALTRCTLEKVGASSTIHVMEKDLIQIWRHMRRYKIIIILDNESPFISKAVSTLLVLGEYIFFELR